MSKVVAISGTHNAGKTTLSHRLYSRLLKQGVDVGLLTEVADRTKKTDRVNLYAQYYILDQQVCEEDELIERHKLVISDRSVFDNLAYMTLNLQNTSNLTRLHIYQQAWELFLDRRNIYDKVILVDGYYPIHKDDPKRDPNERWQKWILSQIHLLLDAFYNGEVLTIKSADLSDEELNEILGRILED